MSQNLNLGMDFDKACWRCPNVVLTSKCTSMKLLVVDLLLALLEVTGEAFKILQDNPSARTLIFM